VLISRNPDGIKYPRTKNIWHPIANLNANGLRTVIYLIRIDGENYSQTSKIIIK
jgi:hypothetical protein